MNQRKQPNILFLMSDEHRADVTGYEGNTVIRTPVLDELARTGVVFRNAYTPSPICVPGRQAILSGQFPRSCGCERFGEDLAPGYMTYPRRLAEFGYETAVSGKLHLTGTGPDAGLDDSNQRGYAGISPLYRQRSGCKPETARRSEVDGRQGNRPRRGRPGALRRAR
ncbi:sulfatase-like hydrolase/transferase [Paenibacillus sp. TAB 01]|uniref:sulfatase-like hydrolase/transferase n=1 Tax=Paenibacillus sp. TAB 01 TaxID=3368988 RepID=UPI0037503168